MHAWERIFVYARVGVCVHGEREDVCIRKGWSVHVQGERGCVDRSGGAVRARGEEG